MHTPHQRTGLTTAPTHTVARDPAEASELAPSRWTRARLVEPSSAGYVYLGASSGPWRLPPALPRARRRVLLRLMHTTAATLREDPIVERADVFRGLLRPPGTRSLRGQDAVPAAFDAVLLVQTRDTAAAAALLSAAPITTLLGDLEAADASTLAFAGCNVRRIGDVDHDRAGVFLFNYFTADDVEANLYAWGYTAGWFQDQTGLDNSTVLRPLNPAGSAGGYSLVNHCRWDRLRDVVPALVLKPSFRNFVLRTFAKHRTAPHPVLYRLAR
jgi:hypothetical protein